MKTTISLLLLLVALSACGPKPYYETSEGKKKLKHYNNIQFGQKK
ncbi:MAG: hypothetical protein RIB47_00120 [Cyclobacteriaceae bacterium]